MELNDNIELRSEKVRNIIGQIPPRIIRIGIIIFALIFSLFGSISYFYKFSYSIKTDATLIQNNDSIYFTILIPSFNANRLKLNQTVLFNTQNISHTTPLSFKSIIQTIDSNIYITKAGNSIKVSGSFYNSGVLLLDEIEVQATILTEDINGIDWLLNR